MDEFYKQRVKKSKNYDYVYYVKDKGGNNAENRQPFHRRTV